MGISFFLSFFFFFSPHSKQQFAAPIKSSMYRAVTGGARVRARQGRLVQQCSSQVTYLDWLTKHIHYMNEAL